MSRRDSILREMGLGPSWRLRNRPVIEPPVVVTVDWLFVGEPFVGQEDELFDAMLTAIDLKRGENVVIADAVKCRSKLIVALGESVAWTLLQAEVKIGTARGRLFDFGGVPLIVTYHPAYLLRNLQDKALAWEDLCFMRRTMEELKGKR